MDVTNILTLSRGWEQEGGGGNEGVGREQRGLGEEVPLAIAHQTSHTPHFTSANTAVLPYHGSSDFQPAHIGQDVVFAPPLSPP